MKPLSSNLTYPLGRRVIHVVAVTDDAETPVKNQVDAHAGILRCPQCGIGGCSSIDGGTGLVPIAQFLADIDKSPWAFRQMPLLILGKPVEPFGHIGWVHLKHPLTGETHSDWPEIQCSILTHCVGRFACLVRCCD